MAKAVTLDGPAGVGKSTTARELGAQLGIPTIMSGLAYRAVSAALIRDDWTVDEFYPDVVQDWVENGAGRIKLIGGAVLLDEVDITTECRSAENSRGSSVVAQHPIVRDFVNGVCVSSVDEHTGDLVISEGRDDFRLYRGAGLIAFGVYMTAAAEIRAQRRAREDNVPAEAIFVDVLKRDLQDAQRDTQPMRPFFEGAASKQFFQEANGVFYEPFAEAQILLDTGTMELDEVVRLISRWVEKYRDQVNGTK